MLANHDAHALKSGTAVPRGERQPRIFHHSFPATPLAVREALRNALARFVLHMSQDEAGTLELLLAEILNNIVEHSYQDSGVGTITLSMVMDKRGLNCSVTDDGLELPAFVLEDPATFDTVENALQTLDTEELPEGGFGWFLIRDLAEDLGYRREDGRNMLAFRLPLKQDG
ncbi:ATP-binding protein [Thioclava sp. GXIMD2076]|uniref:ATP-binding protein n=1 Tax=Thioclava kandeliae TaxID=3070818 RepID=A0ABV1SGC3_9RHOB